MNASQILADRKLKAMHIKMTKTIVLMLHIDNCFTRQSMQQFSPLEFELTRCKRCALRRCSNARANKYNVS